VPAFPGLSTPEHDILDLIAAGRSNSAIAGQLALSGKTVRNNVSNILAKLQVADRSAAIVRARDARLGSARPSTLSNDVQGPGIALGPEIMQSLCVSQLP
jgi:DNA-binding CsgD family transcriptional regulator